MRFVELRQELVLPPMTLSRLLRSLLALRLLEQDEEGRYRCGPAVGELQPVETPADWLLRVGATPLRQLSAMTRQSCALFHFDGTELVALDRELQVDSVVLAEPGHRIRGHAYHPAAICCFPELRWKEVVAASPVRERRALQQWIRREQDRLEREGFAMGHLGERGRIAAPIIGPDADVTGVMIVGAMKGVLRGTQLREWARTLVRIASSI